jgi:Na+/proline symporter
VNKALLSLLAVFFEIPEAQLIWFAAGAMLFVAIYSSISGLMGVAVTDAFQFILAMTGCIILSVLVINSDQIGGISGLKEKIPAEMLQFTPSLGGSSSTGTFSLGWPEFMLFIGVIWWSSWYPGAEPGGGGYIAQRMLSSKNEKHSLFATLFFQAAHYCLRPWPWILVGLAAVALYPELSAADKKLGYVMAMKDFLPAGLTGLMLAAFFGAYASTISTQLNWGASYLVNDLIQPDEKEANADKKAVNISRIATFAIMVFSLWITTMVGSIKEVWEFILECGAGLGLVLILRWFWWRINVWSEIAATIAPFIIYGTLKVLAAFDMGGIYVTSPYSVFITVAGTTVIWLLVTFLTPPVDSKHLQAFFDKVKPMGNWGKMKSENKPLPFLILAWLGSIACIIGILFTTGDIILQLYHTLITHALIALCGLAVFYFSARKAGLFES